MRQFAGLTKRNLLVYFCDMQAVLFSMMTPLIVLVLYLLFLKGTFVDGINSACQGLEGLIDRSDTNMLANGLLLSGILGSAMITVPFSTLTTVVHDRENKVDYDMSATPVSRVQIILSYFAAAAISSIIMTVIITACGLGILSIQGSLYLTLRDILGLFGTVVLGSVSAVSLFMLVVIFVKTSSSCAALFGVLAAAAGFVIGAYIPVSEFSQTVQSVCNSFPGSSITAMVRNQLLNGLLEHMNTSIGGVDNGAFVSGIRSAFVFRPYLFGHTLNVGQAALHVFAVTAVAIAALSLIYPKVSKRR